jgi:hypothetical protein
VIDDGTWIGVITNVDGYVIITTSGTLDGTFWLLITTTCGECGIVTICVDGKVDGKYNVGIITGLGIVEGTQITMVGTLGTGTVEIKWSGIVTISGDGTVDGTFSQLIITVCGCDVIMMTIDDGYVDGMSIVGIKTGAVQVEGTCTTVVKVGTGVVMMNEVGTVTITCGGTVVGTLVLSTIIACGKVETVIYEIVFGICVGNQVVTTTTGLSQDVGIGIGVTTGALGLGLNVVGTKSAQ